MCDRLVLVTVGLKDFVIFVYKLFGHRCAKIIENVLNSEFLGQEGGGRVPVNKPNMACARNVHASIVI